ncbi:MAG: AAA family ATPase [Bacteroidia bacterium]|nr:AAA family ATPase [Bacteroidia bacterium]
MLAKFAAKNFRGFRDRIEIDLTRHSNYTFNSFAIKDGIIKNGILYGPNGSGKTNFSLAIFDIVNHLSQKWKKPDYYSNFTYAGDRNLVVDFEYTFIFNGQTVEYCYGKDAMGVLRYEQMSVDGKQVFRRAERKLTIDENEFPMGDAVKKNLADNANNVSIVNFLITSYPLAGDNYLLLMSNFVNGMLWFRCLETREFIGLENNSTLLDEFIIRNKLVGEFERFLKEVSGQQFKFAAPAPGDKNLFCEVGGKKILFDPISSTGTQALELLFYWIKRMKDATFVFIDEFDAFYHFKLSFEVCKLLFKLDCQVFTSSHNTYLMTNDLLRPDCNFIVHDNKIKALCDCTDKELRFGHNIEKLFRGDTFRI